MVEVFWWTPGVDVIKGVLVTVKQVILGACSVLSFKGECREKVTHLCSVG